MPKAVPDAPLGARARQWYADADVDAAAAIVAPTNITTRKRLMIVALKSPSFRPLTGELFHTIGQKATSRLRPFVSQSKATSDIVQRNLNSAQLSSK